MRVRIEGTAPLALVLLLAACGAPPPVKQEAYVFGTQVEVTVAGVAEAEARPAIAAVFAETLSGVSVKSGV